MKALPFILMIAFAQLLSAQNPEGRIIYSETIQLDIDIPEEHREQLKGVLPDAQTTLKELTFNAKESIYKDKEGEDDETVVEAGSEDSGMKMKMVFKRPDNQLYKNLSEEKVFEKQEFFGRDFLITDSTNPFEWKLINESKDILGYTCQKAVYEGEDKKVEAWYAPQIPTPNGPMAYGKLPGMILEVTIDDGQTHVVAKEIQLGTLEKGAIKAPKKGKKVSRDEFEKIRAEKEKEMEEEYGSKGGRMIIKTKRN